MARRSLQNALKDRWEERKSFGSFRSWLCHLYNRILLRLPSTPLPGRGSVQPVFLDGRPHPFHVRLGTTDLYVLEEIYFLDEYKPVEDLPLGDSPLILDLGANVGFSLRRWLEHWPGAHIIGVEPDAGNAAICRCNIGASASPSAVTLVQACVGARERDVRLNRTGGEWAFSMNIDAEDDPSRESGAGGTVHVVTVPQLLKRAKMTGRRIALLKCDIEGGEEELFGDCGGWLGLVDSAVVELHGKYNQERFRADIERTGERFRITTLKSIPGVQVVMLNRDYADNQR